MNSLWSNCIQKTGTLYLTRTLRFSDVFKDKYCSAFQIEGKNNILEIGCGPGALSQAMQRWYPNATLHGIDRDSQFIDYAHSIAPHILFSEDDAANLTFQNNSFDVTISNTVQEHIEPSKFFGEQYRVLKENGICLVLSARRGINYVAPCIAEQTEFETEIYQRTAQAYDAFYQKHSICAYPMTEVELPAEMEKYGFQKVSTEYITINLTPDHPAYSADMAHAMINANRQVELDEADCLLKIAPDLISLEEVCKLKQIKNTKYDKRIALYDAGIKQWDTNMSVTMIIRGIKQNIR